MATLGFDSFLIFFFSSLSLITTYFYVVKNSIFLDNLTANLNMKTTAQKSIFSCVLDLLLIQFLCFFAIFINHGAPRSFIIFFSLSQGCLLVSWICFSVNKTSNLYDCLVPLTLPVFAIFLLKCTTYLHFLFFIELVGYTFYFQFLSNYGTRTMSRLVDLYLFYYWSSFLGTILLFLVGYRLLFCFNTSNFLELNLFIEHRDISIPFLFTFGLLFKMGASGVHFLKADFYKYISVLSILNFSVLSSFLYVLVYIKFYAFSTLLFSAPLLVLLLTIGLFFIVFNIKHINNLGLFFGYSGVLTITTSLLVIF